MGECWHEGFDMDSEKAVLYCENCSTHYSHIAINQQKELFSTWAGFGKLWEWAKKQDWWSYFSVCRIGYYGGINQDSIHPDNFADALYSFLKENKP